MKPFSAFLCALTIAVVIAASGPVRAQDTAGPPAISVKIEFVRAETREAPSALLMGLFNESEKVVQDGNVEVVDAVFSADAKELARLAPSLQPRLFVGTDYYEVQRVEYENWDEAKSQPIDDSKPVGQTHYYHFLIPMERAKDIRSEQPVFMTTLTLQDLVQRSSEKMSMSSLKQIDDGLAEHVISIDPERLIK